jgi:Flp pilus assembly protein TadD
MEENRPAEAVAQLREVLRLEPGNVRARQALKTALAREGTVQ